MEHVDLKDYVKISNLEVDKIERYELQNRYRQHFFHHVPHILYIILSDNLSYDMH